MVNWTRIVGSPAQSESLELQIIVLKMLFLSDCFGLNDEQCTNECEDRLSFRDFLEIAPQIAMPDRSILTKIREYWVSSGQKDALLAQVYQQIEDSGATLQKTTQVTVRFVRGGDGALHQNEEASSAKSRPNKLDRLFVRKNQTPVLRDPQPTGASRSVEPRVRARPVDVEKRFVPTRGATGDPSLGSGKNANELGATEAKVGKLVSNPQESWVSDVLAPALTGKAEEYEIPSPLKKLTAKIEAGTGFYRFLKIFLPLIKGVGEEATVYAQVINKQLEPLRKGDGSAPNVALEIFVGQSGKPVLVWQKQSASDLLEVEVNRGRGFHLLTVMQAERYEDDGAALEGHPEWTYRAKIKGQAEWQVTLVVNLQSKRTAS